MGEKELVKKFKIGLFVDSGKVTGSADWVHIKKSTDLSLNFNAETQEFDYISDTSPTTEVMRYKPSLSQSIVMWKGEKDYDLFFDQIYNLRSGDLAKRDVLLVFMAEGDATNGFKAWKTNATLTPSSFDAVNSTITVDINFGGTIEQGTATPDETTKKPIFTKTGIVGTEDWNYPFDD